MLEVKDFFEKNIKYFNGISFSFPKNEFDYYGNPRNEWTVGVDKKGQTVHVFPTEKGTIIWGEDNNDVAAPYFVIFSLAPQYFEYELCVEYRRATQRTVTEKVNELKKIITTKNG